MKTAPTFELVSKTLLRSALWLCVSNVLAAVLVAQCSNPTQVPSPQTISSGTVHYSDNNALAASNVIVNGSASVTFVAGNCIHLQPGFHATAGTAGTTFHAWVETAPSAVSVSPSSGGGLSQQFTFTGSSPSGYSNLLEIYGLFHYSVSGVNACYIRYNRASNLLYLADNSGANWSAGFVPGSGGSASNSYCSINGVGSSFSAAGTQLSVTVSVTFQTTFSGIKNEYLNVYDNEGLNSTWQQMGTWTVPATPPQQYYLTTAVSPTGGGTISPASGWYNSGTVVTVSATANGGYQFSGFSGDLTGTTTPQYLTMNGPKSVTANFAAQSQYYVTTAVWPAAGGTISPASGWYAAGTVLTVTATANSGHQFSGFSGALSGLANPQTVAVTGPLTITANFVPSVWKGINYSPRRHTYFRMLYDWYTWDATAAKYVYQMVDDDLTRLSQNGFNLLHLYLWDQEILRSLAPNEPAGFLTAPSSPSSSPNGQWQALGEFVSKAQSKGLFVALHFVSGYVTKTLNLPPEERVPPETIADDFIPWAGAFIQYLTPAYRNVLMWGLIYSVGPIATHPDWDWSVFWKLAYKGVDDVAVSRSPSPGVLGLIGVNLGLEPVDPQFVSDGNPRGAIPFGTITARNAGYTWHWQFAQQTAKTMRDLLTAAYGYAKDPDIYMMQLWEPNSWDMRSALNSLSTGYVADGIPVPADKVFVVEFATSSSLTSSPNGNNIPYFGDNQTPTTTVAGHSQWLNNALCAYSAAGIQKFAYWAMYDPQAMWNDQAWEEYWTAGERAWVLYWGLAYEGDGYGDKPAWSVLRSYYLYGSLSCPTPLTAVPPIVSLTATSDYYTLGQPITVTWTAADVASLSLNRSHGPSYSCNPLQGEPGHPGPSPVSSTEPAGSCAFTDADHSDFTEPLTVTVTGNNGVGAPASASATVNIGAGPIVNAVTDFNYGNTIYANGGIIVWGNGFSRTGGNSIQLTRPGFDDVWLYAGDGDPDYWDKSHFQINAGLQGRAAPGQWTLYVRNGYSGTPSAAYNLTIVAGP